MKLTARKGYRSEERAKRYVKDLIVNYQHYAIPEHDLKFEL